MSEHTLELNDPAAETHLEEPMEDNETAASGILLQKADYEPEATSLNSSAILDHPEEINANDAEKDNNKTAKYPSYAAAAAAAAPAPATTPTVRAPAPVTARPSRKTAPSTTMASAKPLSTSTELSTHVVDLNQTMPWKLIYPVISRDTIIMLCKATAINFLLPFVNGVFLGFGEICAHELAYRWGWTNSAHVVKVPGRQPASAGNVGIRAAGSSNLSNSYISGQSGISGLGRYENEFE
ncbi:Mitochondrial inner membrane protein oxa1 [Mortierella polycephala]|uniref:Mitochondrial inner membrane protein oxa1 n=1 Tax=Mortierella polycephala TaxID=41804 RepID=A0A9P6PNV0_9FUNG|nr:Mitochondrial inner membrane protein oxa1 [Mortierella polycephala]